MLARFAVLLLSFGPSLTKEVACPTELQLSTPLSRAPDPKKLEYRTATTTGSFTDSESPAEGERYRDFALRASQDDAVFATFRQTYFKRKYAGIEKDPSTTWNSAYYGQSVEATLHEIGQGDLLARAIPIIVKLDKIGAGYTQPLKDQPDVRVSGIFMRYLAKVADLERLFGSLTGMNIIEIGVGYGGFASLLLSLHPDIARCAARGATPLCAAKALLRVM